MSRLAWQAALTGTLRRNQRPDRPPKVAVVGMGQTLRGDDAVGPIVAGALQGSLPRSESVLIVDAGPAPENFTGKIRRFGPDLVLLIDAAELGEAAGRIRLLDHRVCTGISASTHTLPPSVIADYLIGELHCEIALLGIQPLHTDVGAPLSAPVRSAVDQAVAGIMAAFGEHGITSKADLRQSECGPGVPGMPGKRARARVEEEV